MKIHIKNGRLIDPDNGIDAQRDVFVAAGKVVAIGDMPTGFGANRVIDATGRIVCPGLVDLAVRLREPGFEYLATLESEMKAAIAGGVTSLACPPDTDPPLDEPGLVEMLKFRAKNLNQSHVYPIGALTTGLKGERLTEMAELRDAGCVAFSQAEAPFADNLVLLHALEYAATFGFPVWLRAQDPSLARLGVAHDGEVATRLGLPAIPVAAEVIALSTILIIARETGARVHIARLSSAEGVAMVRDAKARGLPVTCDIGIHHAHLSEMDIGYFDPNCNLMPPLRSQRDRDALRAGLADGTIDALCSDHTPIDEDVKQLPFSEAEPGATGVELLLPLALKWAEESGVGLGDALSRISARPAAVLGIEAGRLTPGTTADICIFDPAALWRVEPAALHSQGKNTPYSGIEVRGRVTHTLVSGNVVYELK
ncbi:MAG: dihydroorotase [Betaproteobacteria bacterium]|jgi:dihydroorotase|nr:dihydroorotase [Betaproteobacteria bacterium]MDH5343053.1 dihydroorotase [Betaproteobacteria bacterium]